MKYEVKVSALRSQEDGKIKRMNELYLVDAVSCTDAEATITAEVLSDCEDGRVVSIKESPYSEVREDAVLDEYKYFKAKISLITVDEKTGKEVKEPEYILIQSADIDDARKKAAEWMKPSMIDMSLDALSETKILEYYGKES